MATRILLRRDTAANWTADNPILALGEPGYDETNLRWKMGDGVTPWATLPYATDAAPVATGTVTLATGTGTVTGQTSLTTAAIIAVYTKTVAGTPGALYVSAKTAGTGFTVTSTSASDASTVYYEIHAW